MTPWCGRPSGPAPVRDARRPVRLAHLCTVDMSLALLLGTELAVDVEEGFDVFGISAPGPWVAEVRSLGVTHVPVPELTRAWDPRRDLAAARRLTGTLRALRLDVLHTHNPKTGVLGRVIGRLVGVPVVVNTCHGLWVTPSDRLARRAGVYGAEAVAARFSHAELFQNAEDLRSLRRVLPSGRARVVGNGVDLDRFHFDGPGRARVRAEWGIGADELVVGSVGRRVAEKGLAEFGVVARALGDRARFVWVGPDDADKADRATTDEPGVAFPGLRHDMPAVYSAFDVFVLPSHREGFSRSAMEAAACARPMVLSDIRGCREIGTHDEHLLLAPVRDEAGWIDAVGGLVGDPGRRARLGRAAGVRAAAVFDQRAVARASIETYRRVAAARGLGW